MVRMIGNNPWRTLRLARNSVDCFPSPSFVSDTTTLLVDMTRNKNSESDNKEVPVRIVAVQGSGQHNIIGGQGMSGEEMEELFNLTELHGKGWTTYEESIGDRHAKEIVLNQELNRERLHETEETAQLPAKIAADIMRRREAKGEKHKV